MKILSINDKEFSKYGKVLNIDTKEIVDYLHNKSKMPLKGNIYVRKDIDMDSLNGINEIKEKVYGFSDIEVGYCNGYNSLLNCLEYHACPEVDIAGDDLVLLLATQEDVKNEKINSSDIKAFLLKKGDCVILNPYIFHFSPCKLSDEGFKSAIILTNKTNMDLDFSFTDKTLWKLNKWLFAHKDSPQAKLGAYIGIDGENIEIKY